MFRSQPTLSVYLCRGHKMSLTGLMLKISRVLNRVTALRQTPQEQLSLLALPQPSKYKGTPVLSWQNSQFNTRKHHWCLGVLLQIWAVNAAIGLSPSTFTGMAAVHDPSSVHVAQIPNCRDNAFLRVSRGPEICLSASVHERLHF